MKTATTLIFACLTTVIGLTIPQKCYSTDVAVPGQKIPIDSILPKEEAETTLSEGDKAVPALTIRQGKSYKFEMETPKIRILKEAIDRGWRGEKIEFLDTDGRVVQTVKVFPNDAVGKTANYFIPSPKGEYLAVLNSYSIINESGKEEWHDSATFYNNMGELMWREIPRVEDQESRFEFTSRFPRDKGTMLEILPFQAEIIHKNEKGEIARKTQLQTWTGIPYYEEEVPFQVRTKDGGSSPYVAMARMDGESSRTTKRYELYLINADTGEVLWRREVANRGCDLEGIYAGQGVLIAREWAPAGLGGGSFRAYDLEGNELWEMSAEPSKKIKADDLKTLKLIYTKRVVEHSIGRDIPLCWKKINARSGETVEKGNY